MVVSTPLKNMLVSWDFCSMEKKMFQTTNQIICTAMSYGTFEFPHPATNGNLAAALTGQHIGSSSPMKRSAGNLDRRKEFAAYQIPSACFTWPWKPWPIYRWFTFKKW